MKKIFLLLQLPLCIAIIFVSLSFGCLHKAPERKASKYSRTNEKETEENSLANQIELHPQSGELLISTTHAVPLYEDIHSACAVDLSFGHGMSPRNILDPAFINQVKALNFFSLQYSGGSTADHDHVIVGDTMIYKGEGNGYNISAQQVSERGQTMQSVLDGVGAVDFGKDFFNEYCALLKRLDIHGDVIANVQGGTLQELYWKIDRAHAKRVIFGMEQNLKSNVYDFPDGDAYGKKISAWTDSVKRKYPGIITVIDAAPIYKPRSSQWNNVISEMKSDEARLYFWDKDLFAITDDPNTNLAAMDQCFQTTIPNWLQQFQQIFPGKKVAICQWGVKRDQGKIYNTMLADLYIGMFYQWMIDYNKQHSNFIGYASFMSLKGLMPDDQDLCNHYYALKLCGKLFEENKNVVDVAIGIDRVKVIACEEDGKFTLLFVNETSGDQKISSVKVDDKATSTKIFHKQAIYSSALSSTNISLDNGDAAFILLKPYSVSVVQF